MARDFMHILGTLTVDETRELAEQAYELLPTDGQLEFIVARMRENPDFIRDEAILTFESEARELLE